MRTGCLHISAFPSWVFERLEGASRRVVVMESGRVIAFSHSLRQAGILVGMRVERARSLVPDAVIRVRDRTLEQAGWEGVLSELHTITPFLESDGPGSAFFAAPDLPQVRDVAARLRAHVGVAPSRSAALLAAHRAAVGNVIVLEPADVKGFVDRYEVSLLETLGYSAELIEHLGYFGYRRLGQVVTLSRRHLEVQFGDEGKRLYALLHPERERPVPLYQPPPVIACAYDFDFSCREPGDVLPVLDHLVKEAASKLQECTCRRLRIILRARKREAALEASRIFPEPVRSSRYLYQTACTLLMTLLEESLEIELLEVELGTLRPIQPVQATLFRERPSVRHAVEMIHKKYPGILKKAVLHPYALFPEERMNLIPSE